LEKRLDFQFEINIIDIIIYWLNTRHFGDTRSKQGQ
jgi:hypothetical protein